MRIRNQLRTAGPLIVAGVALVLSASNLQAACKVLAPGTAWAGSSGAATLGSLVPQAPDFTEQDRARSDQDSKGANRIVGMWITDFILEGTTTPADHALEQFSSDGNDVISSSGAAPATDNKCSGIWRVSKTGEITLTHLGFDFFADSGAFKGTVRTLARFRLDRSGERFEGTFEQDEIDAQGNVILNTIRGTIRGRRFQPANRLSDIDPR